MNAKIMRSQLETTIRSAAESYMLTYAAGAESPDERAKRLEGIGETLRNWLYLAIVNTMTDALPAAPDADQWSAALQTGFNVGEWLMLCDVDPDAVEGRLGDPSALSELIAAQLAKAGLCGVPRGFSDPEDAD